MLNIKNEIKGLILDMDGVLWRGNETVIDLPATFKKIADHGLEVCLVTNNSTQSRESYLEKFERLGVRLAPHQVINSGLATAYTLKKQFPDGGCVFVVGEDGLVTSVKEQGFSIADQNVVAVVAGIDRELTYQKIATAMRLIRSGAGFFGTNPDKTYPMPDGLIPGAGTVLAAIEAATDVKPVVVGKPNPFMFEMALDEMKLSPGQALVIGDRLDTDIAGGQTVGCRTALVLSGVTTLEQAKNWSPKPDLILNNLAELF